MDDVLREIVQTEGAIGLARYPELRGQVRGAVARGALTRVLPGVYAPDASFEARVAAAMVKDPNAVVIGASAARLVWHRSVRDGPVEVATGRQLQPARGYHFRRGLPHPDLVLHRGSLRVAHPALSVLQMLPEHGPDVIDDALRQGAITLAALRGALELAPHVPGNAAARRWIEDSRDEPWSAFERAVHRALRAEGIDGWVTNLRVQLDGRVAFLDIAFPRLRLAVELDGWEHHRSHQAFIADRERDVQLQLRGWRVLRFAYASRKTVVASIVAMIRQLGG